MFKAFHQRLFLTFIVAAGFFGNTSVNAQDCPDASYSGTDEFSPSSLPTAYIGIPYSEGVTVRIREQDPLFGSSVISGEITNVSGLPSGLTYSCSASNCDFAPLVNGCLTFSGTINPSEGSGNRQITISITYHANGGDFQQLRYLTINLACPTYYYDSDGDGYGNPNNSAQICNPPPGWVLNGDDCNDYDWGTTIPQAWYRDYDGDGYGNPNDSIVDCNNQYGYVANSNDCDDNNSSVGLGYTWYQDSDGDGYGNWAVTMVSCPQPTGYVADQTDCDDTNASVHPGATEYCDGLDNDCNYQTDDNPVDIQTFYRDNDGDGYGDAYISQQACSQPYGYVTDNTDCDDYNSNTYPGAPEICDGQDNNCNSQTDESPTNGTTYYRDADNDTYGDPYTTINACSVPSGYVENNLDCNDSDANVKPGGTEVCDGADNDCNSVVDDNPTDGNTYYRDADADGYGDPDVTTVACSLPSGYVANANDCDDSTGSITVLPTAVAPSGTGTELDPYLIASWPNLLWISENSSAWNKQFKQTADIDASITSSACYDGTERWVPIGNLSTTFSGVYDGQGYTITGLKSENGERRGLFGTTVGATLRNIRMVNPALSSSYIAGSVVAFLHSSSMTQCSSIGGSVFAAGSPGGLVGTVISGSVVDRCYSTTNVSLPNPSTNGGGLCGFISTSTVRNCYASGLVDGSYSSQVGGFSGSMASSTVRNCYAFGQVLAAGTKDGFSGGGSGCTISGCFWNTETSGLTNSSVGSGLTTAQMQARATFTDAGYDFQCEAANGTDDIWGQNTTDNSGFPFLSWQGYTDVPTVMGAWYRDADGDGFGNPSDVQNACSQPSGYVANDSDCNDADAGINPNTVWYQDSDSDGFGNPGSTTTSCTQPTGYVLNADDCDDGSSSVTSAPSATAPSGSGTELDPYLISELGHLIWMSETSASWASHFKQTDPIFASATAWSCFNGGQGFLPIAASGEFTGTYDGNGTSIIDLYINRNGTQIGFFSELNGATITDLDIGESTLTSSNGSEVGMLAGKATNSTLTKCSSFSNVSGYNSVGGLVGIMINGTMDQCISWSNVSGGSQVGGLAGVFQTATATDCYAMGSISVSQNRGGGLLGFSYDMTLENCFAAAGVSGLSELGGLCGTALQSGFGGMSALNCFWDTEASGQATTSGPGTGKTTIEMKTLTTYTDATWDFQCENTNGTEDIWGYNSSDNNGYPFLSWEGYPNAACSNWTGAVSTDWNNGANWSTGSVPVDNSNVVIGSASVNQPQINASVLSAAGCGDLTIESGASLIINAGKGLTVNGEFTNNGYMLVRADAAGIGSLITFGGTSGSGSVEMEQYLTGSGGSTPNGLFYYVGSPVVDANASSFDLSSGNKLWSADEPNQNYPQITNEATVLNVMQGYVARMGSDGVISFEGSSFNSGTQTISGLTRTGTTAANRGYNLVSNPYPSTVEWSTASRTNLETTMWMRTHQGNTMLYDTYNATSGIGTNNNGNGALTGDIPPTQAFWVRVAADGQTGTLSFDNAYRNHASWSSIYKTEAEEGTVRLSISNGQNSDETIILFNTDAQDGYDDYDSQKFWAPLSVPQLYTAVGTDTLVINGLTSTLNNPVIDLGMKLPSNAEYTIEATDITVVGESVYLEDRALSIFQDLNAEPVYTFTSDGGNHPDRFALHFGLSVTDVAQPNAGSARVYANGSQLTVQLPQESIASLSVLDVSGRTVYQTSVTQTNRTIELNVPTGIYLVRVEAASGTETFKVALQ